MAFTSRNLKLSEADTYKFVELYKSERLLYDYNLTDYKSKEKRLESQRRIAQAMEVRGFGPKEVAVKFKNLRNAYSQELKKIADTRRLTPNDVHVPRVRWFALMDTYLRPFVQKKANPFVNIIDPDYKSGDKRPADDSPDEEEEEGASSRTPSPPPDRLPTPPPAFTFARGCHRRRAAPAKIAPRTAPHFVAIRPAPLDPQRKILKFTNAHDNSTTYAEVPATFVVPQQQVATQQVAPQPVVTQQPDVIKLESADGKSSAPKKEDAYDHFGRFIASLLRDIGPPAALHLQHEIVGLVLTRTTTSIVVQCDGQTLTPVDVVAS